MPVKMNADLRREIVQRLQSGSLTTHELAEQTHQSVRTIACTCGRMRKDGELTHSGPYKRYRWHLPGDALPLVVHRPMRHKPPPPPLKTVSGITAEDLQWMEHYRQRAEQRAARAVT
jgi:hypothetical protein